MKLLHHILFGTGSGSFIALANIKAANEFVHLLVGITGLIAFFFYLILLDENQIAEKWKQKKTKIANLLKRK